MSPPLRAAALGAALLCAGCDYWDNLFEKKGEDHQSLRLVVRDALTRKRLTAQCRDSLTTLRQTSNGNGEIEFPAMDMGAYIMLCSRDDYHNRVARGEVRNGETAADTVELARQGGASWYPGDAGRMLELQVKARHGFRIPDTLELTAFPADSGDNFIYSWSSTRDPEMQSLDTDRLIVPIPRIEADTVTDLLSVNIETTAEGVLGQANAGSPYHVGQKTQPVTLVRNLKPHFKLLSPPSVSNKLGCVRPKLRFNYQAWDEDGSCRIFFDAVDSNTALGVLHNPDGAICPPNRTETGYDLDLTMPDGNSDNPIKNKLKITVRDDNGGSYDTILLFDAYVNIPPKASLVTDDGLLFKPQGVPVRFKVFAQSVDQVLTGVEVDWQDSSQPFLVGYQLSRDPTTILDTILTHIYQKPGNYLPRLIVTDFCEGETVSEVRSLHIYPSAPEKRAAGSRPPDP